MIETKPNCGRVLMEGGRWLVPPEERPVGWEKYGLGEPEVKTEGPTEEQVAEVIGAIAEQQVGETIGSITETEQAETGAKPVATETTGPLTERSGYQVFDRPKANKTADMPAYQRAYRRRARHKRAFAELVEGIHGSAEIHGINDEMESLGRLMLAGMFTNDLSTLSEWAGVNPIIAEVAIKRFIESGIWSPSEDHHGVHVGDETEITDFGFWLNVMVGAGELEGRMKGEGMVYAKKGYQWEEKT